MFINFDQWPRYIILRIAMLGIVFLWGQPLAAQENSWKAGVSTGIITPETPMWMAGYAARDRPAESSMHDLWVKALAIEDSMGRRAVFVSSDLLGLPKNISDAVATKLMDKFQLERSQIMLTSSHTHSGPVLSQSLIHIYPLDDDQKQEIEDYAGWLENKIVDVVSEAMTKMEPSQMFSGVGQLRFAVNRRNNSEKDILVAQDLKGPVDHSVPVLKLAHADGTLQAVVFGYACHATTLNGYQWSGDYPGFAQIDLESQYPGAVALFFAGCGGDQNPLPRRTIPLAKQYGRELSAAVSRVMEEPMTKLDPSLFTSYSQLELSHTEPLKVSELQLLAASDTRYQSQWASHWLKVIASGTPVPTSYPHYPIQTWQLGNQTWVALGGEVVVDYSIYLKRLFGQDLFVTAYANDVMAYIPSLRVLREGGYEGDTSMRVYGLPASWSPEIEQVIIREIQRQIGEISSNSIGK